MGFKLKKPRLYGSFYSNINFNPPVFKQKNIKKYPCITRLTIFMECLTV